VAGDVAGKRLQAGSRGVSPRPDELPFSPYTPFPKSQMRAEIEQASDAAKQSIGLLRRHL